MLTAWRWGAWSPHSSGTLEDGVAARFYSAATQDIFWARARCCAVSSGHWDLASWVRRCQCHEADAGAGCAVSCPCKPCRSCTPCVEASSPTLPRPGVDDFLVGPPPPQVLLGQRAPCTIWRGSDRDIAATFVATGGALLGAGGTLNRVAEYVADTLGPLRSALLAFAVGGEMPSDSAITIRPYELCMLDDTRVESTRTDISHQAEPCRQDA